MQIIKSFFKIIFFISPITLSAQSTYFSSGSKEYQFIDRIEIKQQNNTDLNFSALRPYNRKYVLQEVSFLDSQLKSNHLSASDQYNLESLFMNNNEWSTGNASNFIRNH